VRIDELTSALLENRFDTGRTGLHLRGELREPSRTRLLRGEPAVCVGREQELTQLETIFDQCVDDRAANMVLLTGAPGVGKSRLGQAFLRRLAARDRPTAIWIGEADAPNLLASFGLLAQVLRRALGILDHEPIDARRKKIREWALRHPEADGPRFAEI